MLNIHTVWWGLFLFFGLFSLTAVSIDNPMSFYGAFGMGFLSTETDRIDLNQLEVANACARDHLCGPSKPKRYVSVSEGYLSNKLGVNYAIKDDLMLRVELGFVQDSVFSAPGLRKFQLSSKIGPGSITAGHQNRLFANVAKAATNVIYATGNDITGALYVKRGQGIHYTTDDLISPITINIGFFQPKLEGSGSRHDGKDESPALEISASSKYGVFEPAFALYRQDYTLATMSTLNDLSSIASIDGSQQLLVYSTSLLINLPSLVGSLALTGGDPVFLGATKNATVYRGARDKIYGVNLGLQATLPQRPLSFGVFYGGEHAKLGKMVNGVGNAKAVDKTGIASDIKETASTYAANVIYRFKNVDWMLEFSKTSRFFDKQTVNTTTYFGLAATTEFKS